MSIFSSLRYCLGDPNSFGNVWLALAFLPFGLFFDFLDGRVARWRNKSSLMGQELDSLADLVRTPSLLLCGRRKVYNAVHTYQLLMLDLSRFHLVSHQPW